VIRILIGHRGTGKSSLLKRILEYYRLRNKPVRCLDLDDLIVAEEGKEVSEIFVQFGEAYFRRLELETFAEVWSTIQSSKEDVYLAVGAGFAGEIPLGADVLWVRRPTDLAGRIFFDRPPLNAQLKPLADYLSRVGEREERYRRMANEHFTLLEGFLELNAWEPIMLGLDSGHVGGYLTVSPGDHGSDFFDRRRGWGLTGFELRSDLLSRPTIESIRMKLTPNEILYSHRDTSPLPGWLNGLAWDWPLEFGPAPGSGAPIISLHERSVDLESTIESIPTQQGSHIKLAVEVDTFEELWIGHEWWQKDKGNRSFLPRSKDGRWRWYRQLFGPQMKIAFWCEGASRAADQPVIADWIRTHAPFNYFAAVLGFPVAHSYTPSEQSAFFQERQMPVVAISMHENELSKSSLSILQRMGLRAAAVTSPLKVKAYDLAREHSKEAKTLKSVNTLSWDHLLECFKGHNSDLLGLSVILDRVRAKNTVVAVWGSGGTRDAIRALLPAAQFCSVRRRCFESGEDLQSIAPETVVWAVSNARAQMPPDSWRPKYVIDLNYTLDSLGREFAKSVGAKYESGLAMFRSQATGQRQFWQEHLRLF